MCADVHKPTYRVIDAQSHSISVGSRISLNVHRYNSACIGKVNKVPGLEVVRKANRMMGHGISLEFAGLTKIFFRIGIVDVD